MKKIGIITFINTSHNYGQILQCYAMQRALREMGYQSFHLKWEDSSLKYSDLSLKSKFIKFLGTLSYYCSVKYKTSFDYSHNIDRGFNTFISKNLSLLHIKRIGDIYKKKLDVDAFICGSDQIWGKSAQYYYLDFLSKEVSKIAYSASFGGAVLNFFDKIKIGLLIKDFKHLGIREQEGIDSCKKCGRADAQLVIDPTLLISSEQYNDILSTNCIPNQEYIFIYMLKNECSFNMDTVKAYARKRKLKILYVTANGLEDEYEKIYPNVDEWLGLVANAKLVLTNSFHCSVFSIIFNKQFLVYKLTGECTKMNLRFEQLLHMFKIQHIGLEKDVLIDPCIDYKRVNKVLEELRVYNFNLLNNWIKD